MKEIWKTIYDNYEISNFGRLKSKLTNKLMSFETHQKGYLITKIIVNGKRKRVGVHRLVALAFIPNPHNYPQINHKDENPSNNCVENLEWCTAKYNMSYGTLPLRMSERAKGEKNPFFGKKHTSETRNKMRKKHYISNETHQKMSMSTSARTMNSKWVNNGMVNKRIPKNQLTKYLENGWNLSRLPNPKTSISLKKYYEENPEKKYWGRNKNKIKVGGR